MDTMEERAQREGKLRDYLIERVMAEVPYTRVNGHRTNRLPNNVNFAFQFIEGESLLNPVGRKGNLRLQWLCMYLRILWIPSCASGYWSAP